MIIGIVGSANSGKDILGKIIQYLTEGVDKTDISFEKWDGKSLWDKKEPRWKIVKFADPLKECTAIMLGCSKQDFENREFKETPLPKEWQDKSTELDLLTPRKVLTRLGTDFARNTLSGNIWINATFSKYRPIYSSYPNWIITDVRFVNEIQKIKEYKNITIKIERGLKNYFNPKYSDIVWVKEKDWIKAEWLSYDEIKQLHQVKIKNKIKQFDWSNILPIEAEPNNPNSPENGLKDYTDFDYIIDNNSTIEELIKQTREILKKEKLI